jgi:hypothetical protein
MTSSDAMDVADLQASAATVPSYVRNIRYPATRLRLIRKAQASDAPPGVLEVLNRLPDRQYSSSLDLLKEIDNLVLIPAYKKNITGGLGLPGST